MYNLQELTRFFNIMPDRQFRLRYVEANGNLMEFEGSFWAIALAACTTVVDSQSQETAAQKFLRWTGWGGSTLELTEAKGALEDPSYQPITIPPDQQDLDHAVHAYNLEKLEAIWLLMVSRLIPKVYQGITLEAIQARLNPKKWIP